MTKAKKRFPSTKQEIQRVQFFLDDLENLFKQHNLGISHTPTGLKVDILNETHIPFLRDAEAEDIIEGIKVQ